MQFENTRAYAVQLDREDTLASFREKFHIPTIDDKPVIYFCGNSLGLQPKSIREIFDEEITKWQHLGVEGHFEGNRPWVDYHIHGKKELGKLIGAEMDEVVIMNQLTVNLHLLLASFYQPVGKRKKILIEKGAFPSDHFAVSSHAKLKGHDPDDVLLQLEIPENGYLSNDVIVQKITEVGDELALVLLPGVQYYTGQFFDLKKITEAGHSVGALVGFDLAHAIGNLPMNLHKDGVDFATWCSYKYLNSGPGNISGIYIHGRHSSNPETPRLSGWWGQQSETRFLMDNLDRPIASVDGWVMSNINVLATSIHLASLKIFDEAGIQQLRYKSIKLTGFLEFLLTTDPIISSNIKLLTPSSPDERGCQLSIFLPQHGKEIFHDLINKGVVLDWREPNVIRVAPTPMYNTFEEVFLFVHYLREALQS